MSAILGVDLLKLQGIRKCSLELWDKLHREERNWAEPWKSEKWGEEVGIYMKFTALLNIREDND